MSGVEVVGAIAAVIGILEASISIFESVWKDAKLNEAFKTVGHRLAVILDTLRLFSPSSKSYLDISKI